MAAALSEAAPLSRAEINSRCTTEQRSHERGCDASIFDSAAAHCRHLHRRRHGEARVAHRYIRGWRFEPPARQHFMPELEAACRASPLEMTRRPYAEIFTAEALRPFLIVTATHGRRGSKGIFSAADRVQDADQLFAFMPYNVELSGRAMSHDGATAPLAEPMRGSLRLAPHRNRPARTRCYAACPYAPPKLTSCLAPRLARTSPPSNGVTPEAGALQDSIA